MRCAGPHAVRSQHHDLLVPLLLCLQLLTPAGCIAQPPLSLVSHWIWSAGGTGVRLEGWTKGEPRFLLFSLLWAAIPAVATAPLGL